MIVRNVVRNSEGFRTWVFGHGYSDYKSQNSAIAQDIESALLEWKNDCFWALQSGIDWKTRLGNHNQKGLLDADIIAIIEKREDVITVTGFESSLLDRDYIASCKVYTIYSQEPIDFNFIRE